MAQPSKSELMPPGQPSDLGPPLGGERTPTQEPIDAIVGWAEPLVTAGIPLAKIRY